MEQWWYDSDRETEVWSNGGMIVTGKLKYWEKIYIVGGRWMDEYGAMVE